MAGTLLEILECGFTDLKFRFVELGLGLSNIQAVTLAGDQYCVRTVNPATTGLTLDYCNATDTGIQWTAGRGNFYNGDRFEMVDHNGNCMNQEHHPRKRELMFVQPCDQPRWQATNYYIKW